MADAVFKGYGGAGYTHSGGGGLLQPNDFHGMAALLVEAKSDSSDSGMHRRRREALRRLLDPIHGNSLVRSTLTCLEREIDGAVHVLLNKEFFVWWRQGGSGAPPPRARALHTARLSCLGMHSGPATRAAGSMKNYLIGKSPIGTIQRVWWRQEDQARPRHAPEPCTMRA